MLQKHQVNTKSYFICMRQCIVPKYFSFVSLFSGPLQPLNCFFLKKIGSSKQYFRPTALNRITHIQVKSQFWTFKKFKYHFVNCSNIIRQSDRQECKNNLNTFRKVVKSFHYLHFFSFGYFSFRRITSLKLLLQANFTFFTK